MQELRIVAVIPNRAGVLLSRDALQQNFANYAIWWMLRQWQFDQSQGK
jgi:hypothetical protein